MRPSTPTSIRSARPQRLRPGRPITRWNRYRPGLHCPFCFDRMAAGRGKLLGSAGTCQSSRIARRRRDSASGRQPVVRTARGCTAWPVGAGASSSQDAGKRGRVDRTCHGASRTGGHPGSFVIKPICRRIRTGRASAGPGGRSPAATGSGATARSTTATRSGAGGRPGSTAGAGAAAGARATARSTAATRSRAGGRPGATACATASAGSRADASPSACRRDRGAATRPTSTQTPTGACAASASSDPPQFASARSPFTHSGRRKDNRAVRVGIRGI